MMLQTPGGVLFLQGQSSGFCTGVPPKAGIQRRQLEGAFKLGTRHEQHIAPPVRRLGCSFAGNLPSRSLHLEKKPCCSWRQRQQSRTPRCRVQMAVSMEGYASDGPDDPSQVSRDGQGPVEAGTQVIAAAKEGNTVEQESMKELEATLQAARQALQNAPDQLRDTDVRQLAPSIWDQTRQVAVEKGGEWWKTTAPWYKWPVAIFVPWFLLVRLLFGAVVVRDLLPLWILGPICSSVTIWLSILTTRASVAAALVTVSASKEAAVKSVEFVEYSRSGRLADDVRALATTTRQQLEEKRTEVLLLTAGKKDAIVKYVENGQLTEDAKEGTKKFLRERALRLERWAVMTFEDLIDRWRPVRRKLLKLMQNVF